MLKELIKLAIVLAFCWFMLMIAGCATVYEVERVENGVETKAKIKTRREFAESVKVHYNRDKGEFIFESGAVTTPVSPLEQAAADIIRLLPSFVPEAQE